MSLLFDQRNEFFRAALSIRIKPYDSSLDCGPAKNVSGTGASEVVFTSVGHRRGQGSFVPVCRLTVFSLEFCPVSSISIV